MKNPAHVLLAVSLDSVGQEKTKACMHPNKSSCYHVVSLDTIKDREGDIYTTQGDKQASTLDGQRNLSMDGF